MFDCRRELGLHFLGVLIRAYFGVYTVEPLIFGNSHLRLMVPKSIQDRLQPPILGTGTLWQVMATAGPALCRPILKVFDQTFGVETSDSLITRTALICHPPPAQIRGVFAAWQTLGGVFQITSPKSIHSPVHCFNRSRGVDTEIAKPPCHSRFCCCHQPWHNRKVVHDAKRSRKEHADEGLEVF